MCSWCFFFFKQKTAYEMRISDWSSDVCSSDLAERGQVDVDHGALARTFAGIDTIGRRTGIRGIEELLPGERLLVTPNGTRIEQAWSPWDHVRPLKRQTFDEAADALRVALKHAIGSWSTCFDQSLVGISGGLDSSIVEARSEERRAGKEWGSTGR